LIQFSGGAGGTRLKIDPHAFQLTENAQTLASNLKDETSNKAHIQLMHLVKRSQYMKVQRATIVGGLICFAMEGKKEERKDRGVWPLARNLTPNGRSTIHDVMLVIRGPLAKKIQVPQPYLCNDNDDLPAAVPENTNVTYPISPLLPLILFCTLGFSIMFAAIICEKWGAFLVF
jgi:hypothetical protein